MVLEREEQLARWYPKIRGSRGKQHVIIVVSTQVFTYTMIYTLYHRTTLVRQIYLYLKCLFYDYYSITYLIFRVRRMRIIFKFKFQILKTFSILAIYVYILSLQENLFSNRFICTEFFYIVFISFQIITIYSEWANFRLCLLKRNIIVFACNLHPVQLQSCIPNEMVL